MEYSFADIDYILSKNDRVNKFYSELKSKFTESGHFSKYDLGPKRNFTTFEDYIELFPFQYNVLINNIIIIIDGFLNEKALILIIKKIIKFI